MKISVAIISKSKDINKLVLQSVDFADEIIIIVDAPVTKPQKIGKKLIYFHPLNNNFAEQRNFALQKVKNDWVLFADDDEIISSELKREIILLDPKSYSGFKIRRIDVCFHQPLLHGETGKTKILRLAKKKAGKFQRSVHENWKIKGEIGELESPLFHQKDNLVSGFIDRMTQYSDIDSNILTKENKPFSYWRLFFNPIGKFINNYIFKAGLLDGTVGVFQAYLMSVQSLTVRVFQWTKRN